MIEASSGRRHTNRVQPTTNKYIDLGQIGDVAPFDDNSDSTQLEACENKLRPRSRSGFASFAPSLSTHSWTTPSNSRPGAFYGGRRLGVGHDQRWLFSFLTPPSYLLSYIFFIRYHYRDSRLGPYLSKELEDYKNNILLKVGHVTSSRDSTGT